MGIGIPLPTDFPEQAYDSVRRATQRWLQNNRLGDHPPIVTCQFDGSWNAVAYRFLACHEHSDAFTKVVVQSRSSHRSRFESERELFNFFINGLSVFECLYYSSYCLGAMLKSCIFPIKEEEDQKNVDLASATRRRGKDPSPLEKLEAAFLEKEAWRLFRALLNSNEFCEWNRVRNILAHRAQPPRVHNEGTGKPDESRLREIGPIDGTTTATRREWLGAQVRELIEALEKFTDREFPS